MVLTTFPLESEIMRDHEFTYLFSFIFRGMISSSLTPSLFGEIYSTPWSAKAGTPRPRAKAQVSAVFDKIFLLIFIFTPYLTTTPHSK